MKNVSKWLVAGSILAVAFACQSNKSDCPPPAKPAPAQSDQSQQNKNDKDCQLKIDKPASAPTTQVEKSSVPNQPVAEKKAAPISVPAIRVAQPSGESAATETPVQSPAVEKTATSSPASVSSTDSITTPATEVKAETSAAESSPRSVGTVAGNETPSTPAN